MADDIKVEGQSVPDGASRAEPSANGTPPADAPWYPEAYANNQAITRFKTQDEFIKSALELEKKIGEKQGVQWPEATASSEDWQAFWKQNPGFPEAPSGYNVTPPKWPEDSPYSLTEEEYGAFLGAMHGAGVPPQHVDAMVRWFERNEAERWDESVKEAQEMAQRAEEALERTYGPLAPHRVAVATEGLLREFNDLSFLDQVATKDSEGRPQLLRNHPEFIRIVSEWAEAKGHDKYVAGGPGGPPTREAAVQQLADARALMNQGKMTNQDFAEVQGRLYPIIYAEADREVFTRTMTNADLPDFRD